MKARVIVLLISTLLAAWLIVPAVQAYADTVIKNDGTRLKGEITEVTSDYIKIKTKFGGEVKVDQDDILKIIRDEKEPPEDEQKAAQSKTQREYQDRLKRADRDDTADAYFDLGKWCEREGLEKEAEEAYKKALELNPYYVPAHEALGHVRVDGKWMTEEEATEKGYVKNEKGMWVTEKSLDEKERKKLEAERRKAKKAEEKKKKEYQGVPWSSRHIIKTQHYEIHCNSTRKIAEMYAKIMEALYTKYMEVFRALDPEKRRSRVFIHRNQKEFMEMERKPMGVGGFYMPTSRDLCGYHGSFGVTGTTLTVLAHEGCHQFQHLFVKGDAWQFSAMPIWLLEGMAVIFEAAEIKRSGSVKLTGPHPDRIKQLQQMIKDEKHINLRTMMDTPRPQFRGEHYNTAGAFTWWLLKGSKKKRYVKLYEEYLLNCVKKAQGGGGRGMRGRGMPGQTAGQSGPFEALAKEWAKKDLDDLEKEWQKYVLKIRLPKLGRLSGDTFKSKELGFEITRPSKKWDALKEKDLATGQICSFQIPIPGAKKDDDDADKAYARFSVISYGNSLGATADESLEKWEEDSRKGIEEGNKNEKDSSKHLSDFKVFDKKKVVICGYDSAMFEYSLKNPNSKWNKQLCKTRRVVVYTTERIYMLSGSAQADKFEEYREDFQKFVDSMVIKL